MKKNRRNHADTKRITMTIDTQVYDKVPVSLGIEEIKTRLINKQAVLREKKLWHLFHYMLQKEDTQNKI